MIFDTGKPGRSKQDKEAFEEETSDILDSISAVHGKEYASVVANIFTIQNIHAGLLYIIAGVVQKHADDLDVKPLQEMLTKIEAELVHDLAHVLIPILLQKQLLKLVETGKDTNFPYASCLAIVKQIMADVSILNSKQDEYNLGVKL